MDGMIGLFTATPTHRLSALLPALLPAGGDDVFCRLFVGAGDTFGKDVLCEL